MLFVSNLIFDFFAAQVSQVFPGTGIRNPEIESNPNIAINSGISAYTQVFLYCIQRMFSFFQSAEKSCWDAARNGDASLVKNYLNAGADVNYKNPNKVVRNN